MRNKAITCWFAAVLLVLCLMPSLALAETYIHGYLRYEVEDQSVTITGYAGREQTVVIPNMIGGNPVNVIASGAFADANTVAAVYLPSSVVTVEEGAFGVGQAVVFGSETQGGNNGATSSDTNSTSEQASPDSTKDTANSDTNNPANDTANNDTTNSDAQTSSSASSVAAPLGIRTANGSLVTVDSEGNLVYVNSAGTEYVVDDTRTYTRETLPDGTATIRNEAGEEVAVADDGSRVSFADAEGRKVFVDSKTGVTTIDDGDNTFSMEEAEIEDEAAETQSQSAKSSSVPLVPILVVVAIVVAVCAAVFLWKRKK